MFAGQNVVGAYMNWCIDFFTRLKLKKLRQSGHLVSKYEPGILADVNPIGYVALIS